jgi:hypothetical protein
VPRTYLPIVPTSALRRHRVHEPFDTRFRSAARLLQSLWRSEQGLPIGSYTRPNGDSFRLGSMITDKAGERGSNFLLPEIARLARREVCYRQPGAFIEERRLWTNLLSSMPMCLNLLGPLRLDLKLATKMLRAMFTDLAEATVEAVLFEHSPGRGSVELTQDATAFDAVLIYSRPDGSRGFIAIETKYSESLADPVRPLNPRYAELAPLAGLHHEPKAAELSGGPLRQFFRQHLLAQATLMRGDFSEGRFIVIAPELNTPVQAGIRKYADTLVPPNAGQVGFSSITLEWMIELLRQSGDRGYARQLHARYCDWSKVDEVIEAEIAAIGRPSLVGNDNAANDAAPAATVAA